MWFLRDLARARHLDVVDVTWDGGGVLRDLAGGDRLLLIGFGEASEAARFAADTRSPSIWLSPFLTKPDVAAAMVECEAPGLVVGSLACDTWDRTVAARLRWPEVLQLTSADAMLQIPGDPDASLELLRRVVERSNALIRKIA
jgi:hypothetical protein